MFSASIRRTRSMAEIIGSKIRFYTLEPTRLMQFAPFTRGGCAWQAQDFHLEVDLERCEYIEKATGTPHADHQLINYWMTSLGTC